MNADRAELLQLLSTQGVLKSTDDRPVVSHDGTRMSWMLDSLHVSMTARGAELVARCLLEELAKFEATQIATYGVTAIPLMQACITHGGGKYTGLVVRKEPKGYGAGKIIEGAIDPSKPVVILDDSIASGSSIFRCVEKLEAAGLHVEGGVILVRFGFGGGWARMRGRGMRMEMVFDVFRDMVPIADPARQLPANLSDRLPPFTWADSAAPDGLHPTALARRVIECFLAGAPIPRPPARLDADYDASGGSWVSARSRANVFERHARNGYWVLPGEPQPSAGEAIVKAALRTAPMITREQLDGSSLAVTSFGALEPCTVGELDQDRYGILVRSLDRPDRVGGALPSMPTLFRDWAQFDHARSRNAKLLAFERFELWRHPVTKAIEPGAAWQVDGVPRPPAPGWHAHAPRIAERAREIVRAVIAGTAPSGECLPDDLLAGQVEGIYLSVFRDGQVVACVGNRLGESLDETLRKIASQVPGDPRFARVSDQTRSLVVVTSLLDKKIVFPAQAPSAVAPHVDLHRHALVVQQNTRTALLLPFVALQHSLSQVQFVAELVDKAGITRAPYHWTRMEATSWYADGETTGTLPWGLPPATPPASIGAAIEHLLPRMLEYLRARERPDGLRDAFYRALVDHTHGQLERPRQIHGAWTIAAAHRALGGDELGSRAQRNIDAFVDANLDVNEAAVLLLALCDRDPTHAKVAPLVARLADAIDGFGGIATAELPPLPPLPADADPANASELERYRREHQLDYVLPQVVLALARAPDADNDAIHRGLRRAARRFEILPSWAQVCWLPQAAAAVHALSPDPAIARVAFDVVDWALPYQQTSSGGFLNNEADSPGCMTAVYLEGLAAALELAVAIGDRERADRYRAACLAAVRFVDELTYQERDRGMLPAPERAYGGVRFSRTLGEVRTDFVQHAVHALLRLRPLA